LPKIKSLAAHAERERRRRSFAERARVNLKERFRRERVGGVRRAARRLNLGKGEGLRRVPAGVEKKNKVRAVEVERVLDLQLEVLDRANFRPGGSRHPLEQERSEPVVATRVVAPAEDNEPQRSAFAGARNKRARGIDEIDLERHLPERVCGARQARIVGADRDLDMVQEALGDLAA
jgi:hypothetical protein